ncbi:hypothetical protein SAMN02745150_00556 [Brevinema andersonii]|uniref:Uncharacterized protein n=1 Tax=Brevinema andersonii TaxID=34097 RepID=A0A1I1DHT2_BREAD|nr:hypothetical protein [Brevinema andersonii]SFB74539.1 hypothetical protein SAMN02745150_00556 [Brevinema andersonii]
MGRGATYAEAEFNKLNQTSPVPQNAWNFRDKTSTDTDIKSIITAFAKVWTRLKLENNNFYYYDSQDTENWTFNAENKQVTIQFISGSSKTEKIYDIGMRSSIDDNNGIFVLSGAGKKYD